MAKRNGEDASARPLIRSTNELDRFNSPSAAVSKWVERNGSHRGGLCLVTLYVRFAFVRKLVARLQLNIGMGAFEILRLQHFIEIV